MASWTLSWKTRISSQDGLGLVEVAGALKSTRGIVAVVGSSIPKHTSALRPRPVVPQMGRRELGPAWHNAARTAACARSDRFEHRRFMND